MATIFPIPSTQPSGSTTGTTTTGTTLTQRDDLPAEAMAFNGKFFEDQIDGYQTLYVRGRESMLAEINAYEVGVRDGTGVTSRRYPARELVIGYLLHAKSNEAFREAYNTLNGILYTQDAQVIFNDEIDKYFTGTPEGFDEIESGRNFVQGEIIIYCADPFKYSTTEKVATVSNSDSNGQYVGISYNGTYKAYPRLEANFPNATNGNPDCGYVSWAIYNSDFSNDGSAISLGNMSETQEGEFFKSETLIDQTTNYDYFNVDSPPSGWTINYGSTNSVMHVNIDADLWGGTGGVLRSINMLYPDEFSRDGHSVWTGVNASCSVPKASDGNYPTTWKVTWKQVLSIGNGSAANTTRGGIQVIVSNSSDTMIAAANMYRSASDADNKGRLTVHTKNYKTSKTGIDYSYSGCRWGTEEGGTCTMTKSGSTVSFNLGGLSFSLTDSDIANEQARRVTVVFLKTDGFPSLYEGLKSLKIENSSVSYWKDVANTFGKNDTAVADCNSGKVTLNGSENASLGVINNDWESFCFYPGDQNVRFICSKWCENQPTTTVYYREVFI